MERAGLLVIVFWVAVLIWFIDLLMGGASVRGFIPWICVAILGLAALGVPSATVPRTPRNTP